MAFERRKRIIKPSDGESFKHKGRIVVFKDTRQVTAFKKKFPNVYWGFRNPDDVARSHFMYENDLTIRYEDIPVDQLKEREAYWMTFFATGKLPEGDEPYGRV